MIPLPESQPGKSDNFSAIGTEASINTILYHHGEEHRAGKLSIVGKKWESMRGKSVSRKEPQLL
jgi:hypothetical protein